MDNEGLHAHPPVSTDAMGGPPHMARGGMNAVDTGDQVATSAMEMSGVAAPLVGSTRRTSRVWRYFGMMDNCHYICHLCSFVGAYTNTTNMRKHIQHHHPERYQDILDHTRPTTRPFYGGSVVGSIRPTPQHFPSQPQHHHHPYPSAAAAAAAAALVYPHNIGAAKRMLFPKPPDVTQVQANSASDKVSNSHAVTSHHHPLYTNHPSSSAPPSQSWALAYPQLPSTSSGSLENNAATSYSCSVVQSAVASGRAAVVASPATGNLPSVSVTACELSPEESDIVSQLLPPINPECSSDSETRGLTGGDDRGSSEYSQNDEEAAASGSPEFLGDGSEQDPTPAPAAQTPPKPESYQLRHNNHLTIVLEALARDEAFMDVTLTAQGRSLKAHKSVLSAVSPYFRGVLRENPCQHPIIIMPRDVRFEELFSIVNYIYKGEMTVAAEDLTSLLKTAEILQVSGLAPSDSSATVNPHTAGNIRSSSSSSSASSNVPPVSKAHKNVKETNQGISAPVTRPKSPETMINPSDFMDMDMTYVKEEIQSGGEDDDDTAPSETNAQPSRNISPKASEIHQDTVTFTSVYNQNQEQTAEPSNSSQDTSSIAPIKTETEKEGRPDLEQIKSVIENPQPFICPHCQGIHRGLENMNNHLRLNHPTKPSFTCACGRVFTRSMSHLAHIKVCNVPS